MISWFHVDVFISNSVQSRTNNVQTSDVPANADGGMDIEAPGPPENRGR